MNVNTTAPATGTSKPGRSAHLQHGPASDFDLGALVGEHWGPGRVDVTADARDNRWPFQIFARRDTSNACIMMATCMAVSQRWP